MAIEFLDHDVWFGQLPGVVVAAAGLITDPEGNLLMVKPNYRDHWTLPGGICELGEPPHLGCAREVAEEVGLDRTAGALLAVDWSQPFGDGARPILHFVFDCGVLAEGEPIVLQQEELDDYQFVAPDRLDSYTPVFMQDRIAAAFAGKAGGATVYQPTRVG
jgi:8-oxo-dGTP diphosphatase